jgi:glyceraldehyde 3-phosphate dehydrogenase
MAKRAKVAINGFGRIGRQFLKAYFLQKPNFDIVAINDLTTPENLAYLLTYDSAYGPSDLSVSFTKSSLKVNGVTFPVLSEKDPSQLPWEKMGVDVVVECTGFFVDESATLHLDAGARKVVVSAPGKHDSIQTFLRSVNDKKLGKKSNLISNASCTTNCIAPVISLMHNKFGVVSSLMTTVHAATSTQKVVDSPSPKDFRKGRSTLNNMIPTSTGAAKATTKTIPELEGKFDGISVRVPVLTGSLSDITMLLKKKVTVDEVNTYFKKMEKHPLYKGVIKASEDALVSSDIVGQTYSAIIDLPMTRVVDGNLVKVLAWYDNEWGYAHRLVEMVALVSKK